MTKSQLAILCLQVRAKALENVAESVRFDSQVGRITREQAEDIAKRFESNAHHLRSEIEMIEKDAARTGYRYFKPAWYSKRIAELS